MRHRKSGRKLGRNTSHRKAMMRNMVTSFFDCEKITTTDARAKELRKIYEGQPGCGPGHDCCDLRESKVINQLSHEL